MNYLPLLVFFTLVTPLALKEYKKDKGAYKTAKTLNLIVAFVLFYFYTNSIKNEFNFVFSNTSEFKIMLQSSIGFLKPIFNSLTWFLYVFFSFVFAANTVFLALRKEKSRILLLKLIPVMWILNSIHLYKYFLNNLDEIRLIHVSVFILTVVGIFGLIIFILYSSKSLKLFFQNNPSVVDSH